MAQITAFNVLEAGLPANMEAERFVLAQCLIEPTVIETTCDALSREDFTSETNRNIWDALCALHSAGERVDRVMVAEWLLKRSRLDAAGGLTYMVELENGMPQIPNIEGYIRSIRQKTIKRKAMLKCNELLGRLAVSDEETADIFADAESAINKLTGELAERSAFMNPGEIITAAGGLDSYLRSRAEEGIRTPWPKLNRMTGGFKAGNLIVLAAQTGRGKTAMALNIGLYAAMHGHGVALFSMEMDQREINDRFLALSGQFDSRMLRRPEHDPNDEMNRRYRIREAVYAIADLPLHVTDRPALTTQGMLAELRRMRATKKIELVIVDYLQLAKGSGKFGTRAEEVASISRGLKGIAMELGVPVIALSQFNRESSKEGKEPELHDLKESSGIEQDANMVLMIHFTRMYDVGAGIETGDAKLLIRKNRSGPVGWLPIQFHAPSGIFRESTDEQERA